jgi:cob(I)alamin adenosyltransferase
MEKTKGFVQLYTGNGKGKTTAALGISLRVAGAGKRVFFAQFVKGMPYSELNALSGFDGIKVKQYGRDCFIKNKPTEDDILAAQKGFDEVKNMISSDFYDVVVLDEICIALHYNLINTEDLISILKNKPEATEIILTGRYAPSELIDFADLVTEMKEIKHYFTKGIQAREGIEF